MDALRDCAFWLNGVLRYATRVQECDHVSLVGSNPREYPLLDTRVNTLHAHFAVHPTLPSAIEILLPKSHATFPYTLGEKNYNIERHLRQHRKQTELDTYAVDQFLLETSMLRPTLERTADEVREKEKRVQSEEKQKTKQVDRILNDTRNIRDALNLEHVQYSGGVQSDSRLRRLKAGYTVADRSTILIQTRRLRGVVKESIGVECNFDGDLIDGLKSLRQVACSAPLKNNDISLHLLSTVCLRVAAQTECENEEDDATFPIKSASQLYMPISVRTIAKEGLAQAEQDASAVRKAMPHLKAAQSLNSIFTSERPYNAYSLAHKQRPYHIDIPPFTDNDIFDLELSAKNRNFELDIEVDFPKPSSYFISEVFAEKVKRFYLRRGRMPGEKQLVRLEMESWDKFAIQALALIQDINTRGFSFTSALSKEPHWFRSLRARCELLTSCKGKLQEHFRTFVIDDKDRLERQKQEMAWCTIGPLLFGEVVHNAGFDGPNSSESKPKVTAIASSTAHRSPPGIKRPSIDLYRRVRGLSPFAKPYMSKVEVRSIERPTKLKFKTHEDVPSGYTHFDYGQPPIADVSTNPQSEGAGYFQNPALVNNGMHHHTQPATDFKPIEAYYSTTGSLQPLGSNCERPAIAFHFPLQEPNIKRECASWVEEGLIGPGILRRAGMRTLVLRNVTQEQCETPVPWARKEYPNHDLAQQLHDMDEYFAERNARRHHQTLADNGGHGATAEVQTCAVSEDSPLLIPNQVVPDPADDVFTNDTGRARNNLYNKLLAAREP